MPCHTRMKRIVQGLLWLLLLEFGFTVMSLEPGFLDFDNLPDTNFSCVGKVIGGYYADLETNCQMFHVCTIGQLDEPMDIRFLCLNGTVFDQETRVCERIDEVDCSKSEQFYSLNLELYGNTQPPILEESPEVDLPVETKRSSTTTTTTTTTTRRPVHPKSTTPPYFTTSTPPTTTRVATKVITSHHFPVVNAPDIRFNPEEINISLNPGAPPDITRSQAPVSFQQQSYSEKNTRVTVTTHTTSYKNDKPHRVPLLPTPNPQSQILIEHQNLENPKIVQTTQTPKSVVSYGLTHNQGQLATPTEVNYGFTYQQTEESVEYQTEVPPRNFHYQSNIANLRPPPQIHPYVYQTLTTSKRPTKVNFPAPTTFRTHSIFSSSIKSSSSPQYQRTEKPPRLQLPLPLLPTLPPLTFSSPAPFSLGRHIETKRYTNEHQSPPRIIISASASVSDNSGRRLNYSLGTIGATEFIGVSPESYDDYKEDDVGLDPFYHDVPKIKSLRHKRSTSGEELIKDEKEAEDLLRFLFNWYTKRHKDKIKKISIPVNSDDITEINEQLAPIFNVESSTSSEENHEGFLDVFKENSTQTSVVANRTENTIPEYVQTELNQTSVKQPKDEETIVVLIKNQAQKKPKQRRRNGTSDATQKTKAPRTSRRNHRRKSTTEKPEVTEVPYILNPSHVDVSSGEIDVATEILRKVPKIQRKIDDRHLHDESKSDELVEIHESKRADQIFTAPAEDYVVADIETESPLPLVSPSILDEAHFSSGTSENEETETEQPSDLTSVEPYEELTTVHPDLLNPELTSVKLSEVQEQVNSSEPLEVEAEFTSIRPTELKQEFTSILELEYETTPSSELETTLSPELQASPNSELQPTLNLELQSTSNIGLQSTSNLELQSTSNLELEPTSHPELPQELVSAFDFQNELTSTLKPENDFSSTPEPQYEETPDNSPNELIEATTTQNAEEATEHTTEFVEILKTTPETPKTTSEAPNTTSETIEEIKEYSPRRTNRRKSRLRTNKPVASRRSFDVQEEDTAKTLEYHLKPSRQTYNEQRRGRNNYIRSRKFVASAEKSAVNVNHEEHQLKDEIAEVKDHTKKKTEVQNQEITEEHLKEANAAEVANQENDTEAEITEQPKEIQEVTFYPRLVEIETQNQTNRTEIKIGNQSKEGGAELETKLQKTETSVAETDSPKEEFTSQTIPDYVDDNYEPLTYHEHENERTLETETTTTKSEMAETLSPTETYQELLTELNKIATTLPTTVKNSEHITTEIYDFTSTLLTTATPKITTPMPITESSSLAETTPFNIPETTTEEVYQTTNANTETTLDVAGVSLFTTTPMNVPEHTEENEEVNTTTEASTLITTEASSTSSSLTEPQVLEEFSSTTDVSTTTTNRYQHLRTRVPWYRRQDNSRRKESSNHRFSSKNRRKNTRDREVLNSYSNTNKNNHINQNTAKLSDNESLVSKDRVIELQQKQLAQLTTPNINLETTIIPETSSKNGSSEASEENKPGVTDAPLLKSANPTKAKYTKIIFSTTPLSKLVRVELRKDIRGRRFTFNCFDKVIHRFYSDPRDCRLFHYCTSGYTRNQMVDMKFVCDLGTYFDDEKMICTKNKPARCI